MPFTGHCLCGEVTFAAEEHITVFKSSPWAERGLAREIYIDDKPEGYEFAGDHPRLTGAELLASLHLPEN